MPVDLPAPAASSGGGISEFTSGLGRKLGPLPVWAWALLALALLLGWMYWKKTGIFAPASGASPTGSANGGYDPNTATDTGAGGGGLGDALGDTSTLTDPNRTGSTGTGSPIDPYYTPQLSYSNGLAAVPQASATPAGNGAQSSAGAYRPATGIVNQLISYIQRNPVPTAGPKSSAQYSGGSAFGKNPG